MLETVLEHCIHEHTSADSLHCKKKVIKQGQMDKADFFQ